MIYFIFKIYFIFQIIFDKFNIYYLNNYKKRFYRANQIHSIKIILLGSTLSEKISITQRMVNNIFDKTINITDGVDMKSYYYFNKYLKLDF